MREAQHGFQHAQQRAASGALLRVGTVLQLHLGDFHIPVAVLVPDELVDRLRDIVEAVVDEALLDLGLGALQQTDDPAVGLREIEVAVRPAVLAFAVHKHKAGRVPQLVAEVAVAFTAVHVELDVAAGAGEAGEGEAQRICAVGGDALRELLARALLDLLGLLRVHQAAGALLHQLLQADAVDQVDRVEHVALGLGHLLAFRVADQAVHVDILERNLAGDVLGHHHHARHPEEDDVEAGHQHRRRQVEVERGIGFLRPLRRPVQSGERPQRGGIPGVQHVLVARQLAGVAFLVGEVARFLFAVRDEHFAVDAVPGGNLVTPPQLARNAPVLNVVEPLVVGVDPVFRVELDLAVGNDFQRLVSDALAVRTGLGHCDEPLVGQHRLDHHAGPVASRHLELVFVDLFQQAERIEVGHDRFTRVEAVHAAVLFRRVVVDLGVQREDGNQRQVVALAHRVVVEVVGGRHLDHAGAELAVHVFVGDDGNLTLGQRQLDGLADQVLIALVVRVHHHRRIAEHGLGSGGGHD